VRQTHVLTELLLSITKVFLLNKRLRLQGSRVFILQ